MNRQITGQTTVVQLLSRVRLFVTLMDCSTPGSLVLHCLSQFAQTRVHWVDDAIQPSHPLSSLSCCCLQSFPASGSFPMSSIFTSGGQSIGVSASASVLPMNIQDQVPLGLASLISLLSKDSQESSLTPLFKITNSSALSFLYSQLSHPQITTGKPQL